MDTILYGASYYSEYMPYERTDEDVALMKKAGISVVRIGEFAWGLWEPEDGRFEFAWMDRVVDKLHAAGIRIILGTPTASIPAWMYKEHPEIVRLALAMLAIRQMGCCGVRQQRWFFIVPFPLRA